MISIYEHIPVMDECIFKFNYSDGCNQGNKILEILMICSCSDKSHLCFNYKQNITIKIVGVIQNYKYAKSENGYYLTDYISIDLTDEYLRKTIESYARDYWSYRDIVYL